MLTVWHRFIMDFFKLKNMFTCIKINNFYKIIVSYLVSDVKREGVSGDDDDSGERRDGGNGASQCGVVSQNRSFSPHVFLPKEWTY